MTSILERTDTMLLSAYMYITGSHPDGKNIEKAIELYKQSIELKPDDTNAMFSLANIYFYDLYSENAKDAIYLYEKAIDLGHIDSIKKCAYFYDNGTHPDGRNIYKSIKLYEKASNLNCSESTYILGLIFEADFKNKEKALFYYEKASKAGHIKATYQKNRLNLLKNKNTKNTKSCQISL